MSYSKDGSSRFQKNGCSLGNLTYVGVWLVRRHFPALCKSQTPTQRDFLSLVTIWSFSIWINYSRRISFLRQGLGAPRSLDKSASSFHPDKTGLIESDWNGCEWTRRGSSGIWSLLLCALFKIYVPVHWYQRTLALFMVHVGLQLLWPLLGTHETTIGRDMKRVFVVIYILALTALASIYYLPSILLGLCIDLQRLNWIATPFSGTGVDIHLFKGIAKPCSAVNNFLAVSVMVWIYSSLFD